MVSGVDSAELEISGWVLDSCDSCDCNELVLIELLLFKLEEEDVKGDSLLSTTLLLVESKAGTGSSDVVVELGLAKLVSVVVLELGLAKLDSVVVVELGLAKLDSVVVVEPGLAK